MGDETIKTSEQLTGALAAGRRDFPGLELAGADLTGCDLKGVSLSGADLSGATLTRADLTGATLSQANLSGARLDRCEMRKAAFLHADLSGVDLTRADLAWSDLSDADLSGATLVTAHMHGAQAARVDFDATAQVFKEVMSSELGSNDIQSRAHDAPSGAAEQLIQMDVDRDGEDAPGVVISAGSLKYTLHPAPVPGSVLVFISDADGQKIVSEMVDPKEHTPDKLRSHLLAERAPDAEFAALNDGILRIAA